MLTEDPLRNAVHWAAPEGSRWISVHGIIFDYARTAAGLSPFDPTPGRARWIPSSEINAEKFGRSPSRCENKWSLKTALRENETTLFEKRPMTSGLDHFEENS